MYEIDEYSSNDSNFIDASRNWLFYGQFTSNNILYYLLQWNEAIERTHTVYCLNIEKKNTFLQHRCCYCIELKQKALSWQFIDRVNTWMRMLTDIQMQRFILIYSRNSEFEGGQFNIKEQTKRLKDLIAFMTTT